MRFEIAILVDSYRSKDIILHVPKLVENLLHGRPLELHKRRKALVGNLEVLVESFDELAHVFG